MALIKSSLLSSISGSIGGSTYARARGGLYVRNRTIPINPRTAAQGLVRATFGAVSSLISTLTLSQVNAWKDWAHGVPQTNRLGETYYPSWRAMFQSVNQNLALIGLPPILDPPFVTELPSFNQSLFSLEATEDTGILDAVLITTPASAGGSGSAAFAAVKMSPPLMAALGQSYRNRMRGPYLGVNSFVSPMAATLHAFTAGYKSKYADGTGDVPAPEKSIINYAWRVIDSGSGLSSAWFYGHTEVVSVP